MRLLIASGIILLFCVFCLNSSYNDEQSQSLDRFLKSSPSDPKLDNLRISTNLVTHPLTPHHVRYSENTELRRRLQRPNRFNDQKQQRHSRSLQLNTADGDSDPTTTNDALYQGYGTHYVDLWVGTPPQRQTVIVDTGSSVTAFPCSDCPNCGKGYHIDNAFQEQNSQTFSPVTCDSSCWLGSCDAEDEEEDTCSLSVSYQEGSSWTAREVTDVVYSGGPHDTALTSSPWEFPLHFGCQVHLSGLFKTQLADGIMGMEMASTSFWKQMHDAEASHDGSHLLPNQQFSLCFSRQPVAEREGTGAGAMTLGGTDPRLHLTPLVFAAQMHEMGWFTVRIRSMYLRTGGGERITVNPTATTDYVNYTRVEAEDPNNGDVIVDSGTTDTYLTSKLSGPFRDAWRLATGDKFDNDAHDMTAEQLLGLPTILIQLEGHERQGNPTAPGLVGNNPEVDQTYPQDIIVAMPPSHYMEYSLKTKKYTARIYFNEGHGGVLGANFMMGHDILFDVDNARLGFSESECDYSNVADASTTNK